MQIREITSQDAAEVAAMHIQGISTGFISSLGVDFVKTLYEAIAKNKFGFGLRAQKESKIIAFVAFCMNFLVKEKDDTPKKQSGN